MKKKPSVAIATINFNSEDMTLDFLRELKGVDYANKTLWVLDNGSKLNSFSKVREAKKKFKFNLLKLKENRGYAGGANYLIDSIMEKSNPDYILFVNNDMLFPDKKFLSRMVRKIEPLSDVGIINPIIVKPSGKIQNGGAYLGDYLKYTKRIFDDSSLKDLPDEDYFIDLYCGCAWLVRSKVLREDKMRFQGEYFAYCEDEEFCLRLRKKGYRIMVDVSSRVVHLGGVSAGRISTSFALYHITRNEFWMRRAHASGSQKIIYFLSYFFTLFPKRLIYLLFIKRDFSSIRDYFRGLYDGLFKKYPV